mmetsp:Transcript_33431/g.93803  ORF Transcript_33431/g.93803 Transcript_33431/m.93803 type:complete len:129 (-) Transcript_33431:58-444(-)
MRRLLLAAVLAGLRLPALGGHAVCHDDTSALLQSAVSLGNSSNDVKTILTNATGGNATGGNVTGANATGGANASAEKDQLYPDPIPKISTTTCACNAPSYTECVEVCEKDDDSYHACWLNICIRCCKD